MLVALGYHAHGYAPSICALSWASSELTFPWASSELDLPLKARCFKLITLLRRSWSKPSRWLEGTTFLQAHLSMPWSPLSKQWAEEGGLAWGRTRLMVEGTSQRLHEEGGCGLGKWKAREVRAPWASKDTAYGIDVILKFGGRCVGRSEDGFRPGQGEGPDWVASPTQIARNGCSKRADALGKWTGHGRSSAHSVRPPKTEA